MLSLQELEVFLVAAEQANFSEAGRLLHLSQPAISQTIHHLEKRIGTQLFVRDGRSVRLSEAGQALLPMARDLLASANRLEDSMLSLQGEIMGRITIGCSTGSGKYLLPGLVARFREQFPQVRIDALFHDRDMLIDKLLEGQINFGVSNRLVEHHNLEYLSVYTDELVLIVPANHRWARSAQISADDLLDEPLILREVGSGTREVLLQGLGARSISPDMVNEVMVLGNAEAMVMAVEQGIGLSFVSRLAAARALDMGRVVEVNVDRLKLTRELYFVRSRHFPLTRSQSEFWEFLRAADEPVFALPEKMGV